MFCRIIAAAASIEARACFAANHSFRLAFSTSKAKNRALGRNKTYWFTVQLVSVWQGGVYSIETSTKAHYFTAFYFRMFCDMLLLVGFVATVTVLVAPSERQNFRGVRRHLNSNIAPHDLWVYPLTSKARVWRTRYLCALSLHENRNSLPCLCY